MLDTVLDFSLWDVPGHYVYIWCFCLGAEGTQVSSGTYRGSTKGLYRRQGF